MNYRICILDTTSLHMHTDWGRTGQAAALWKGSGFLDDSEWNLSQQFALAARRGNRTLSCTRPSTASWEKEGTVPLVQPHLEHWGQVRCQSMRRT